MCHHPNAVELATGQVSCLKCPYCNEVFVRCVHCGGKLLSLSPSWFFMRCIDCGDVVPKEEKTEEVLEAPQLPLFKTNA